MKKYCCESFKKLSAGYYITVNRNGKVLGWYCSDPYTIKTLDKEYYPEYQMDNFVVCPYCSKSIIS